MAKKAKKPAPARATDPPMIPQDAEKAIELITQRIEIITRDYAHDPDLVEYRDALALAVDALRRQL